MTEMISGTGADYSFEITDLEGNGELKYIEVEATYTPSHCGDAVLDTDCVVPEECDLGVDFNLDDESTGCDSSC